MQNSFGHDDASFDAALKSYANSEPLADLEERILNRVITSAPILRRNLAMTLLAAGIGLVVVCVLLVVQGQRNTPPTTPKDRPVQTAENSPALADIQEPVPAVTRQEFRRPIQRARKPEMDAPRREVNKLAKTPTAEERALLRFVEQNPEQAALVFASFEKEAAPLEFRPLEIKPLESGN
jgi:hypothetical protein